MYSRKTVHRHRRLSDKDIGVIALVLLTVSTIGFNMIPPILGIGISGSLNTANMVTLTTMIVFEALSWIAAPLYAWLTVQWYHAASMSRIVVVQLLVVAVLAEIPYDLSTTGKVIDASSQNPVFALVLGVFVLAIHKRSRHLGRRLHSLVTVAVSVAAFLWILLFHIGLRQRIISIGAMILAYMLIFEFLHSKENIMMYTAGLLGAIMFLSPAVGVVVLHYRNDDHRSYGVMAHWCFMLAYPILLLLACIPRFMGSL